MEFKREGANLIAKLSEGEPFTSAHPQIAIRRGEADITVHNVDFVIHREQYSLHRLDLQAAGFTIAGTQDDCAVMRKSIRRSGDGIVEVLQVRTTDVVGQQAMKDYANLHSDEIKETHAWALSKGLIVPPAPKPTHEEIDAMYEQMVTRPSETRQIDNRRVPAQTTVEPTPVEQKPVALTSDHAAEIVARRDAKLAASKKAPTPTLTTEDVLMRNRTEYESRFRQSLPSWRREV